VRTFLIEVKSMTKKTKLLAIAIAIVILVFPLAIKIIDLQNTKLATSLNSKPLRVACVGDSITAISGYPSKLQSMLGDNYQVGNFGVVGSTVSLNSWKPYMAQPEFQSAEAFQPDIVVIILGTNDDLIGARKYSESFQDDYTKLIISFQQLDSDPDIWIAKSPPIFSNNTDLSPSYLTDTIISQTEDLANQLNLPVIDLYSAFGSHSDYFLDGVHPNDQGASIIAGEVYNTLDSTYNISQTP
jgi:lysophospholipase L1-like esterase